MSSQSNAALEQILGQEDAKFVEGIVWLVNHEAWARDVFNRGFDAGWQDAMNMGLRNAEGTYSSLINEPAITSQRPSGSPYPHISVREVYTDAYDSGYVNAMWELNKVNPGAGARLNALNGAAKIDRDKEPLAFASWERKMALHMQGYDGPSMEAAAALGLAVLSGIAPTAAMLKQPATPGAAQDPMVSTLHTPEWEEGRALGALEYEAGVPPADMDAYQRMNPYRTKKDPFRQQAWFDGYMSALANKPLSTERRASEWAKMKSVAAKTSGTSTGASDTSPAMAGVEGFILGLAFGGVGGAYLITRLYQYQDRRDRQYQDWGG